MTVQLGSFSSALASKVRDLDQVSPDQLIRLAIVEGLSFQKLAGIRKRVPNLERVKLDEYTRKQVKKSGLSAQELAIMGLLLFLELEQDHESE